MIINISLDSCAASRCPGSCLPIAVKCGEKATNMVERNANGWQWSDGGGGASKRSALRCVYAARFHFEFKRRGTFNFPFAFRCGVEKAAVEMFRLARTTANVFKYGMFAGNGCRAVDVTGTPTTMCSISFYTNV